MKNLTTLVEKFGLVCHSEHSDNAYRQKVEEIERIDSYHCCPDSSD